MGGALVVDTNVILSALIANGRTRLLLVSLDARLVTPSVVEREIGRPLDAVVEKSGLGRGRVEALLDICFRHVDFVPVAEITPDLDRATAVMDGADALVLATALTVDGAIWSDDRDFDRQSMVSVHRTCELVERVESVGDRGP